MAKLPEIEIMRKALLTQGGKSEAQISQEIDKLTKEKPFYRIRRDLMYKYLCDKHGVNLNIKYGGTSMQKGEYKKVSELTSDKASVNLRGYVLNIQEPWATKTGTLMSIITFADESGTTVLKVFQKEEGGPIDILNDMFPNFPAPAYLLGVQTDTWEGKMSVGYAPFSEAEVIGKGDYELPELSEVLENVANAESELSEGEFYVFHGYLSDTSTGFTRIGCPVCHKTLDAEVGARIKCGECGKTVNADEYPSLNIILSDAKGDSGINFSEKFTSINPDYIGKLRAVDLQPEIIVGCKYTEKYGLAGNWLVTVGNFQLADGSGKTAVDNRGNLDMLDWVNDVPAVRDKITDEVKIAELVDLYKLRLGHFGSLTVDESAEYLKKVAKLDKEVQMRPIIGKLFEEEAVRITYDGKIELVK
jgi:hypothetical protein